MKKRIFVPVFIAIITLSLVLASFMTQNTEKENLRERIEFHYLEDGQIKFYQSQEKKITYEECDEIFSQLDFYRENPMYLPFTMVVNCVELDPKYSERLE